MKKVAIKKRRNRPRLGRLKGKAMEELRRACFERDRYTCTGVVRVKFRGSIVEYPCQKFVGWESGHMAHIGAKRRHGDSLDNVRTLCAECHMREHAYGPSGIKPCPKKGPVMSEERL